MKSWLHILPCHCDWAHLFWKVLNLSRTWLLWLSWMAQNLNILVFDPLAGPGKSISGFRSHPQRRHDLLLWSFSTATQTKSIKMLIKQTIWCQMSICRDKVTDATHAWPLWTVDHNNCSIQTGLGILWNQNLRNFCSSLIITLMVGLNSRIMNLHNFFMNANFYEFRERSAYPCIELHPYHRS